MSLKIQIIQRKKIKNGVYKGYLKDIVSKNNKWTWNMLNQELKSLAMMTNDK